jgi:intracellular multiplication protein IcmQ
MKDELSEQQTDAILKALNDAIEQGPWDESNFLRVIGKNLREIRDGFASQLQAPAHEKSKIASHLANRVALRSGQQEIFIALYSSNGTNIQSWERILMNLPKQMISRPVYDNEEDIRAVIKTKENKDNEAYVSMYISQTDILALSADKMPVDKRGKGLLTLKDKSLSLDNINRFVHTSGIYQYAQGRLVKNLSNEEL